MVYAHIHKNLPIMSSHPHPAGLDPMHHLTLPVKSISFLDILLC